MREGVRPTGDRAREALFSVLGERVRGADVVDLYAGSGALGVEALSRGAARVTFVDRDPETIRRLGAFLVEIGVAPSELELVTGDVGGVVRRFVERGRTWDVVLGDPPWDEGWPTTVLTDVDRLAVAGAGTWALELDRDRPVPDLPGGGWATRRWGRSVFALRLGRRRSVVLTSSTTPE